MSAAEAAAEAGPVIDGGADGSEASADATPPPKTCAELQDAGTVASDIYTLDGIEEYCEMTLAGGGWTLVARSATGASGGPFGWKQSLGNVMTENVPMAFSLFQWSATTKGVTVHVGESKTIDLALFSDRETEPWRIEVYDWATSRDGLPSSRFMSTTPRARTGRTEAHDHRPPRRRRRRVALRHLLEAEPRLHVLDRLRRELTW